jgi:hypothetical protein
MPFKSKEQERYLQINEPEIYRDWVEKYGRFKGAESFSAENYYDRKYRGFEIDKEGDERQAFYYITKGNNRIEMELNKSAERRRRRGDTYNYASYFYGNYPGRAEKMFETLDESLNWFDEQIEGGRVFKDWNAESFNSYKVAPDLSSYTKAELVSSIAGPQGTAAYDEVVYDPIAQSRLSAETATQRLEDYKKSLAGDSVCPDCGNESWDEYPEGDEWRGYCAACGSDFSVDSALPNPYLTLYEMEALKEQGGLTPHKKEQLEDDLRLTVNRMDRRNRKIMIDELVQHGWAVNRRGNLVANAESIDSFSPARLIILGASIGVALGLYKTRGE